MIVQIRISEKDLNIPFNNFIYYKQKFNLQITKKRYIE